MLRQWRSQSPVRWYCRYPMIIIPNYRRRSMFGASRAQVLEYIRDQERLDQEQEQWELSYH